MQVNRLISGAVDMVGGAVHAAGDDLVEAGAKGAGQVRTGLGAPVAAQSKDELLADLLKFQVQRIDGGSFAEETARQVRSRATGGVGARTDLLQNERKIARKLDVSVTQVRDAIHSVKESKIPGARRNGDVWVDVKSGEVYPVRTDGSAGDDSIGNLLAALRDRRPN